MTRQVPLVGGEKESLWAALDRHRDVVLWKLADLDDEQLRLVVVPSGTSLLGLVKHLAAVEYGWFCETFGRQTEAMPFDNDDRRQISVSTFRHTADLLAFYRRARAAADQAISELDMDTVGRAWWGDQVSMRWVLIHMIEETARHAGHMDIGRELIDGRTGYHQSPSS